MPNMSRQETSAVVERPEASPAFVPDGIIYFGNDWFAENRTSSHHIAARLAQKAPLLYVETPGLRSPNASGRDLKKIWRKLWRTQQPPQQVGEQMWVMTMPQIPFRRLPLVARLNRLAGGYLVRRAARRLGWRKPISWFVVPHPGGLAHKLGDDFAVYYCIDDYAGLPGVDRAEVTKMDHGLTEKADLVFVVSTPLLEARKKLNSSTVLSPHGVDFDHFRKASDPHTVVAEGARSLPQPVIGYFGSIGGWVDVDLLVHVAKAKPEWTLLLIGLVSVDVQALKDCPNVVFAGVQSYSKLPEWAKKFDVAILPYQLNQGSISANPLKLREYLATGKPVVASSTPEVDKFARVVSIARGSQEFIAKIEEALTMDSAASKAARMEEVRLCTWDARAKEVWRVVLAAMEQRGSH
jgi:glycosyltransferase involved in cell wall biosynthesis